MEDTAKEILPGLSGHRLTMGITILLIEDSRYCAEAVRLMSQRSGFRLRRADSLRSARRHLAIYRPDVVIVDLGLPDGSGVDLIQDLHKAGGNVPGILAISGDSATPACKAAIEQGANCFMAKPLQDMVGFQNTIRSLVNPGGHSGHFLPQIVNSDFSLDTQAFIDDLGHVGDQLGKAVKGNDRNKLRYLAQFTRSIAQTAGDHELMDSASTFMGCLRGEQGWHPAADRILVQVQDRLAKAPAI